MGGRGREAGSQPKGGEKGGQDDEGNGYGAHRFLRVDFGRPCPTCYVRGRRGPSARSGGHEFYERDRRKADKKWSRLSQTPAKKTDGNVESKVKRTTKPGGQDGWKRKKTGRRKKKKKKKRNGEMTVP